MIIFSSLRCKSFAVCDFRAAISLNLTWFHLEKLSLRNTSNLENCKHVFRMHTRRLSWCVPIRQTTSDREWPRPSKGARTELELTFQTPLAHSVLLSQVNFHRLARRASEQREDRETRYANRRETAFDPALNQEIN